MNLCSNEAILLVLLAHAQYVPWEHAGQVAGVCATLIVLLNRYAMPIWKRNTEESEWVLAKNDG